MKKLLFLTLGLGLLIPISSQASTSPCTDGQSCIIKYYSYLNEKNFSKAISLTTGDNKTETAVKTTYKNIERIIPYNIQEGKNSIYTFNIYYKDKGAKESKIFEIKKQYIGNLLKNISSRTLQGVQPAEFSLNDPQNKYEILEQKPISFYTYIEADENWFQSLAEESTQIYKATETRKTKLLVLNKKLTYFKNLLKNYPKNSTMKSYLIRDKTISPEKDFNTTLESFDNNRNGPGITVYVIENKGIYSGNKQFLKDFSYNSGIPTRIPIKAGKQYLLFQELDYCGASICALWSEEIQKFITSNALQLK